MSSFWQDLWFPLAMLKGDGGTYNILNSDSRSILGPYGGYCLVFRISCRGAHIISGTVIGFHDHNLHLQPQTAFDVGTFWLTVVGGKGAHLEADTTTVHVKAPMRNRTPCM